MSKKTVLVVDDSRTVRQEVRATLEPAGYDVIEAVDGVEGVTKSKVAGISVIVCDVNMPNMNGIEMLKAIKGTHRIPVLMMTTEGGPGLIKEAQQAGATAWMVKPFKSEQLLAVVNRFASAAK